MISPFEKRMDPSQNRKEKGKQRSLSEIDQKTEQRSGSQVLKGELTSGGKKTNIRTSGARDLFSPHFTLWKRAVYLWRVKELIAG